MKTGIELIAAERQEQIEKHGRSIADDAEINPHGELIGGAMALIECDRTLFPLNWNDTICEKMINKSRLDRLVIAGALIAAEIDRLQSSI